MREVLWALAILACLAVICAYAYRLGELHGETTVWRAEAAEWRALAH